MLIVGGAMRDRTADLLDANQALSQLSYGPNLFFIKFIYTQKCHNEPVNDQAIEVSTYNKDSKISLRR